MNCNERNSDMRHAARVRRKAYQFTLCQVSEVYYLNSTLEIIVRAFGGSALCAELSPELECGRSLARAYVEQYKANCYSKTLGIIADAL